MNTTIVDPRRLLDPDSPELSALLSGIAAGRRQRELDGRQPTEAMDLIRASRLGAVRVPVDLGGGGATLTQLFEILISLAEADPHLAHSFRSHSIFVEQRLKGRDQVLRDRWISRIVDGNIFGNATTELGGAYVPGANRYRTRLRRTSDGLRLDGEKFYSTGVLHSDLISVTAQDNEDRIVNVIVPLGRDGVVAVDDWDGIGQELTGSGTTRFTDVAITEEDVIAEFWDGTGHFDTHENTLAQLWLQAVSAGIMRSVVTDAVHLVTHRARNFSHGNDPEPKKDPIVQETLGRIAAAAYTVEAVVLRAATALDRAVTSISAGSVSATAGQEAALAAAYAKIHVDEHAAQAATAVFELGGAAAARRSVGLDRHWRNIRTLASHNPSGYKAQAIGALLLTGRDLPANGFF